MLSNETPDWVIRLDELHLLVPIRIALALLAAYVLTLLIQRVIRRFVQRTIELPGVDPARADGRQRALAGAVH